MKRLTGFLQMCAGFGLLAGGALAEASIPTEDIKGATDSKLVGRLAGAFIIDYEARDFDEAVFPLSKLKPVKGEKVGNNNWRFKPDQAQTLEGQRERIVYLMAADSSPLKVVRAYGKELAALGGTELYACKGEECGGSARRASGGGGGSMSLGMYLWPPGNVNGRDFSTSKCAQLGSIANQRYSLMHVPAKNAYVSIHAYEFKRSTFCDKIVDRVIAAIDVVFQGDMEAEFVTVEAEQMATEISSTGKIALYGIQFDSGKASLRPESAGTLDQIGKLLKSTPELRLLIVGHTDSVGSYEYNLDLSQRRAGSVVDALVRKHAIAAARLFPAGVSFASPVGTNATEEGRAKNRRVELVNF
ncbi:DUF4892 domain-containing protein [Aquicoccus sp. G2-2]|uniref:OmpA family protein n=1 Tax=Aquicoccus sp. G2-2 TaxID=3092120 RepID=UPI002AE0832A|nr:DUF4892 domain-containing protein [Aquicoccus sp. G2-2]MEA1114013.1 OmpA family protein [Aquicoccus sp. G2-2]